MTITEGVCAWRRHLGFGLTIAQRGGVSEHRTCTLPARSLSCALAHRISLQLFRKYGHQTGTEPWKKYGRVHDWNIDLVPKLLMANGELTNILVSTDVTKYLDFRQVAGSFVQQGSGGRATVAKVPSTAKEALLSPLMGFFEKRRAQKFLEWVGKFNEKDPQYDGMYPLGIFFGLLEVLETNAWR